MPLILPSRLNSPHTTPISGPVSSAGRPSPGIIENGRSNSPLPSPFLSAFSPNSPSLRASSRARAASFHRASTTPVLTPSPPQPVSLSFRIESPPLILYGKPTESTGALLSGLFTLEVLEKVPFPVNSVHMAIIQEVKTLKPQSNQCPNCLNHTTELARWDVLTHPADLPKSSHVYPFSHLIPGSVPATTKNSVFSVSYHLIAVAVPDNTRHKVADPNHPGATYRFPNFEIKYPLNIKRSIIRGPDRNSVRVFPPTDIVAQISLPSTVFPDSAFPFELVLEGITVQKEDNFHRLTRWRMRKINWRIDENAKIKAFRCPAHLHIPFTKSKSPSQSRTTSRNPRSARSSPLVHANTSASGMFSSAVMGSLNTSHSNPASPALAPGSSSATQQPPQSPQVQPLTPQQNAAEEAFYIEEMRTIGAGEIKNNWKTDFAGKGKIELLAELSSAMGNAGCDIDDPTFGLVTKHTLVIEMVVAEEAVMPKSKQVMPTGAARVLRMQFSLVMTERSGLGIAWDDEVPPVYADVPLSPPEYQNVAKLPAIEDVMLDSNEEYSSGINARLRNLNMG